MFGSFVAAVLILILKKGLPLYDYIHLFNFQTTRIRQAVVNF